MLKILCVVLCCIAGIYYYYFIECKFYKSIYEATNVKCNGNRCNIKKYCKLYINYIDDKSKKEISCQTQ